MKTHRLLRAYLAGIAVPTAFLLLFVAGFTLLRHLGRLPEPAERVIIFPMAVLPNLWGAWNMLYASFGPRRRIPLGLFGAALPLIVMPTAVMLSRVMGVELPDMAMRVFPVAVVVVTVAYYLLWKYVVRLLNEILELTPP